MEWIILDPFNWYPYFQKHALHTPAVINSTIRGQPAYLSGDLLIKHPTEPNLWKYFGRVDDQIVLASGEEVHFYFIW